MSVVFAKILINKLMQTRNKDIKRDTFKNVIFYV